MDQGAPLIGRDAELRRLTAAFEGALSGRGRLVRIVGEPGIGKTRLASEAAELAAARGAKVAWGRCWESGGAPAFWPWTQIVRALGADDAALSPRAASSAAEAEQERFRLFDAMARLFVDKSREEPLVLVVDDAHAADVPSLLFLRFVAQTLRTERLFVLVTHREVEARVRPEIGELLAKIARDGETVLPRRLEELDIATWLKEAGRAERDAAAVFRATEGNPLFVRELLELPAGRELDVAGSDTVRAAIGEHIARLSPEARATLEVAAILGREAAKTDLASLGDAEAALDAHVREGFTLGVIEVRGRDAIAFRHVLLRDELYAAIGAERRRELHARAAEMYAKRSDAGDGDALSPAAHHELLAASSDTTRAVSRARRAAERASRRAAYEEAASLLERTMQLLESRGADVMTSASSCEVLIDWGEALLLCGLGPRGRDVCARGAAIAKALGRKDLVVRSALVYGSEIVTGTRDARMIALLRDALATLDEGDSPLRARVTARLASALIPGPADSQESAVLAEAALEMVRRCGDAHDRLMVLQFYSGTKAFRVSAAERRVFVEETLALARMLGKPTTLVAALPWAVANDVEILGVQALTARIAELTELSLAMPQTHYRVRIPIALALRAALTGHFEEAYAHLGEAAALTESAEAPQPHYLLAIARLGYHHARHDAAEYLRDRELVLRALASWSTTGPIFEAVWAAFGAGVGVVPVDEARAMVRARLASTLGTMEYRRVPPALGGVAWAAALVKDQELVADLLPDVEAIETMGNRFIFLSGCAASFGPTALLRGEMLALLERRDEALAAFDEAIALCDARGVTLYADRARAAKTRLGAPSCLAPKSAKSAATSRASAPPAAPPDVALTQHGEMWTLHVGDEAWTLKPSKGLSYLALLLAHPHQEIHVAQMVGAGDVGTGDAGPRLDDAAKESYRRRATDLRASLDDATARGDVGHAEKAREELDALGEELARAVGLGGRDRRAASDVERMRVNVQRRLRDAIERVRAQSPAIGRYLDASIRTGAFCSYAPAWTGKDG